MILYAIVHVLLVVFVHFMTLGEDNCTYVQGSISIPGSMGMAEVDRVADVVEGFHELVPMVFHYGHLSPDANEKLYRALTSTLASTFEKRCEINKTSEFWSCDLLLLLLLLCMLHGCTVIYVQYERTRELPHCVHSEYLEIIF